MRGVEVVIYDDRPPWMRKEDALMHCWWYCSLFRKCVTRCGHDCKRFGGEVIPKIRGG